jgi:hypothetical protein
VLPNPASLAGDDDPAARYTPPMDAGFTMQPLNEFKGSQLAAVIPAFKAFC